ncbi:hypothetical protein LCL61_28615 [Amycolatopsis coloradensis]|uniref:Uncharacterized protein n=1 Tax=Amycolatopsis coloradensis TaxID=76021 RepID=A0ACD5BJP1_9PSEU
MNSWISLGHPLLKFAPLKSGVRKKAVSLQLVVSRNAEPAKDGACRWNSAWSNYVERVKVAPAKMGPDANVVLMKLASLSNVVVSKRLFPLGSWLRQTWSLSLADRRGAC